MVGKTTARANLMRQALLRYGAKYRKARQAGETMRKEVQASLHELSSSQHNIDQRLDSEN